MSKRVVMTLKEAAEYLNVHSDTLRRRAKNGTIPAFKIGTDWRFYQSSIENWIKEMEEAHKNSVHGKKA
jgi:excisionase family DNA binding protein